MTPTEAGFERDLRLFVPSEIDDYGLDPYEFRIYARIVRRAGRGDAWESIPKMAKACFMSESRARLALQLLEAAGLIESQERSGYSKLRRLKPKQEWTHPETLKAIRQSLTRTKSDTPSKSDRGGTAQTPSKSDTGVVAEVIRLPLSKATDEGIPIESNSIKVLPSNPHKEKLGRESENLSEDPGGTIHSLASLHDELSLSGDEQIASGEGSCPAVTFSPTQITAITKTSSTPTPIPQDEAACHIESSCSLQLPSLL